MKIFAIKNNKFKTTEESIMNKVTKKEHHELTTTLRN
jgi:hypothetical protein